MGLFSKRHKDYYTKEGYKQVFMPRNPMARANGYVAEHRAVASRKLGRSLSPDEVVHHIDGNKRNNRSSNLRVMTRSEHWKIHHKSKFGKRRKS